MIKRISRAEPLGWTLDGTAHVDARALFTTVQLLFSHGTDTWYPGTGTAKRDPADDYDSGVGFLFAMSRALRDVADHMELDARRVSGEQVEVREETPK